MKQTTAIIVIVVVGLILYLVLLSPQSQIKTGNEDIYNPVVKAENFLGVINNPFYTLTPGTTFTYRSETEEGIEKNVVVVTNQAKAILGVKATVVWDRVWLDDSLIEETYDWYAQDKEGNVWYFGEDSKEYEDGRVVSTEGSWEAGVDGAKPGIIMKANPKVGDFYRQEYYKGQAEDAAEDAAEVVALMESITVPTGSYTGCLKTRDYSYLEPQLNEYKYYCPDVGNMALEVAVESRERAELIKVENQTSL